MLCAVLVACSPSTQFEGTKTCASIADCDPGQRCVFPVASGCDAKAVCVTPGDASCTSPIALAGCDDSLVCGACDTPGYAPAPVVDTWTGSKCACASDAGAKPPGTPCANDSDCGALQVCVYAVSAGCTATLGCQDQYCGDCPVFTEPFCGCDGKTIYASCGTVPDGFLRTPVASEGYCDAGVSDAAGD